jgi:hypothetical protein
MLKNGLSAHAVAEKLGVDPKARGAVGVSAATRNCP